jgi:acetyltransferase-like isoleucine patch superfamily enzyme
MTVLSELPAAARRLLHRSKLFRDLMWQLGYGWGPALRSWLRKQWILLSHPHANIVFEGPVHIAPGFSLYMPGPATLIVGPNVEFRIGFRAEIVGSPTVKIGARCVFSYYSLIQTLSDITIGEGCGFGQSFGLFDGNHNFRDTGTPFFDQGFDVHPITIGHDCAILTKTTVLSDVGDHAVIGANSVVTKPIPAYSVAVGAPAKVIEYFGPEEQAPPEILERRAASGTH